MKIPAVAVVAYPNFSSFHLSVPCLIFGDILPGQALFSLEVCATEPGPITSVHGLSLNPSAGVEGLARADVIIVPGWDEPAVEPSPELLEALRGAHARGAQVVGLCLGTYVLAYAGLLDGRRASTHWEFEQDFLARFPQVRLGSTVFYRMQPDTRASIRGSAFSAIVQDGLRQSSSNNLEEKLNHENPLSPCTAGSHRGSRSLRLWRKCDRAASAG